MARALITPFSTSVCTGDVGIIGMAGKYKVIPYYL
jgi:hypothetical protein